MFIRQQIFATSQFPKNGILFTPIPYNEELYFKLYSWIIYGAVVYNKQPYYSRCQMYHKAHQYRYILCRILLSMCDHPIRRYYVYDSDNSKCNQQCRFTLLDGEIIIYIFIFFNNVYFMNF